MIDGSMDTQSIWTIEDDTSRLAALINKRKRGFPLSQKELDELNRLQQGVMNDAQRGILTSAI